MRLKAFFILLLLLAMPAGSSAPQSVGPPRIDIRVAAGGTPVSVAVRGVLSGPSFDELLRSGFPTRLHMRAELWSEGRWFDELAGRYEWDVIIRYDVIERTYMVARVTTDSITPLGTFARFTDARVASEMPFSPPMVEPRRGRKNYYNVQVDVQTIEYRDLDEVRRWLKGEAAPAVQGRRNPGTAITRGFVRLASRIFGGQVRRLEQRSAVFHY